MTILPNFVDYYEIPWDRVKQKENFIQQSYVQSFQFCTSLQVHSSPKRSFVPPWENACVEVSITRHFYMSLLNVSSAASLTHYLCYFRNFNSYVRITQQNMTRWIGTYRMKLKEFEFLLGIITFLLGI